MYGRYIHILSDGTTKKETGDISHLVIDIAENAKSGTISTINLREDADVGELAMLANSTACWINENSNVYDIYILASMWNNKIYVCKLEKGASDTATIEIPGLKKGHMSNDV